MSNTFSLTWDSLNHLQTIGEGDNWPATWGDNGKLYTSFGDGTGFGSNSLSLGFSTISGSPFSANIHGNNLGTNIDTPTGWGKNGIKASGLLMVNGTLALFVRNYNINGDYRHSRLATSSDHGKTWQWADQGHAFQWVSWYGSNTFGVPDFVQYGPNYQGGDPTYVYIISQDNNDAYTRSPYIVLARVPKNQISNINAYEYFSGTANNPTWSKDINQRKPIFTDPNGTQRVSMSFNTALQRYFLVTSHDDGTHRRHTNALGVFDGPTPWGPWTTDYYSDNWSQGDSYEQKFPPMYMSSDGKTMWMLFSGDSPTPYQFTLRKATLTVQAPTSTPTPTSNPTPTSTIVSPPTATLTPIVPTHQVEPTFTPTPTNTPTPIPTSIPTPPVSHVSFAPSDCTCMYNSPPTKHYPKNHCDCGIREGNVCHFTRMRNYGSC